MTRPPPSSRQVVHRNYCYSRRRPSTRRTAPEQEIPMTTSLPATITGYPRIGARRELKRALESHWAGRSSEAELAAVAAQVRRDTRQRLSELGLDRENSAIPSDFTYYDQVLSTAVQVGAVPTRFGIPATGEPL